jgi:hypothetical protein
MDQDCAGFLFEFEALRPAYTKIRNLIYNVAPTTFIFPHRNLHMGQNKKKSMKSCFTIDDYPNLCVLAEDRDLHLFFRFLQHGFFVAAPIGVSIKKMLCDRLGVDPDYADARIKTIFLDGKPVDDMEKAIVRNGCSLALSAAMPGLVGATFRSGGVLSPFRATISHLPENCDDAGQGEGAVFMKLFNLLVPELGPKLLEKGIFIDKSLICEFFVEVQNDDGNRFPLISLNGKSISIPKLVEQSLAGASELVFLRVESK